MGAQFGTQEEKSVGERVPLSDAPSVTTQEVTPTLQLSSEASDPQLTTGTARRESSVHCRVVWTRQSGERRRRVYRTPGRAPHRTHVTVYVLGRAVLGLWFDTAATRSCGGRGGGGRRWLLTWLVALVAARVSRT
jgi:hypothetical protein